MELMELKDMAVSLELAKRLKSLGVKQESWFRWADYGGSSARLEWQGNDWWTHHRSKGADCEIYSAFTVAELGELIKDAPCENCTEKEF